MTTTGDILNSLSLMNDVEEMRQVINKLQEKIDKQSTSKVKEGELSLKQQILLLEKMGILKDSRIKKLSISKQAILFSALLNRGQKSIKDHLTYLSKEDAPPEFYVRKEDNVRIVNELLDTLGITE